MRGSARAGAARRGARSGERGGPGGAAGGRRRGPSGAAASELGGCCRVPPALRDGRCVPGSPSGRDQPAVPPRAPFGLLGSSRPVTSERGRPALSPAPERAGPAAPRARGIPIPSAGRAGMPAPLSSPAAPCLAVAMKRRSLRAKNLPASDVCGFAVLLCVASS